MKKTLRIYLVDDHPIVRQGLRMVIEKQKDMRVIGESGDVTTATAQIAELQPDVVVMDLRFPNGDGIQATEAVKRNAPHIQVLVLTQNDDLDSLQQAIAAGASGYLLKLSAVESLIPALRAAAAGSLYFDPQIKALVTSTFQPPPNVSQKQVELSGREKDVLRLLAQGLSYKEIAAELDIGVKTVESYRYRACEKLELRSRSAIIRYAGQHGWLHDA
ncbi:MAG TPA: response regulator transcription factor [Blastocatellia bacterium]|nr:response regulator transcription factor [Blastocatellia bacterium]HMX29059.1 response regulator transcription factor [Blastocatellia bacterium]HMY73836.1 response regulator transcription factor [Blastocatellia bacterium]HMZ19121.1 response regulator transcription factor [Blastocatellia bacterium]HNG34386.1 response regulator transcription factor [Blastocatellia bacterium]